MDNLSDWFIAEFNQPQNNYLDESVKLDLSFLNKEQRISFVQQLTAKVAEDIYAKHSPSDADTGYLFYFAILECSNKDILDALYKSRS